MIYWEYLQLNVDNGFGLFTTHYFTNSSFTRADEATFKVGCNYFPESGLGAKNVLSREK